MQLKNINHTILCKNYHYNNIKHPTKNNNAIGFIGKGDNISSSLFAFKVNDDCIEAMQNQTLLLPLQLLFSFDDITNYISKQLTIEDFLDRFIEDSTSVFGAIQNANLNSEKQNKYKDEINILRQMLNVCLDFKRDKISKNEFDIKTKELLQLTI